MAELKIIFTNICHGAADVAKQILCILDTIVIGTFLTWIVKNYNKRHGRKMSSLVSGCADTERNTEPNSLNQQLVEARHQIELISKDKQNLEIRLKEMSENLDYTRKEFNELIQTNELFADSIADLKETISSLTEDKVQRLNTKKKPKPTQQTHCPTETELYAEPDATGAILRKITTTVSKYSLYKLSLASPDDYICKFSLLNNEATPTYINNRNMALHACKIAEISANPTTFETVVPGTAVKENNNWVVTSQAVIKIV